MVYKVKVGPCGMHGIYILKGQDGSLPHGHFGAADTTGFGGWGVGCRV